MVNSDEEIIQRIQKLSGVYDSTNEFLDIHDQLLVCESINNSTAVDPINNDEQIISELQEKRSEMECNANGNDSCKTNVDLDLSESQLKAISKLNDFSVQLTPLEINACLEEIFSAYQAKGNWWLYVAQHWTQRQINWVLKFVLKLQATGRVTKHPAACFTHYITHRKKRKNL